MPKTQFIVGMVEVVANASAGDRDDGREGGGELLRHQPSAEGATTISYQVDAASIDPMIGNHIFQNRCYPLYRVEELFAWILRRQNKKRKFAAVFDQFRQTTCPDFLDVTAALIPTVEPNDERIGLA